VVVGASEAVVVGDAVAGLLAVAVGASAAGDVVAGAEGDAPQEASISARHIPEIAVTADDADRRIKPSLEKG
jgi:hypothetical protein